MEQNCHTPDMLVKLLDASPRPIYAVDAQRQIVYCNAALMAWLGLEPGRIVGRRVEYHSETAGSEVVRPREAVGALTDLCPPPQSLAGKACAGSVGCVARDGRLIHRRAEFVPLGVTNPSAFNGATLGPTDGVGVLVILGTSDMRPEELSAQLTDEPTDDELHRAIRRFRRGQATQYAIESLLGDSPAMRKVRSQVAAAASSGANVLIRGRRGSGRSHVARAIHYGAAEAKDSLLPIDCGATSEDAMRRILDALRNSARGKQKSSLLLLDLERLPPALQSQLLSELAALLPHARFLATIANDTAANSAVVETRDNSKDVDTRLISALSTITIDIPPLAERSEDLPLMVQFFLEAANRGAPKQVGSIRPDALDLLSLYNWPGELDELRSVVVAAHANCQSHEISPPDLPAVIHHAAKAAELPHRFVEKIVLEDLLAEIEREVIVRALSQSGGNKSAAADLLGMTRPRLYRRLVQLGLADNAAEDAPQ